MPSGPPIKPRTSYARDATALLRLCEAVELDPVRSAEWKRQTVEALNHVVTLLVAPSVVDDSEGHQKAS